MTFFNQDNSNLSHQPQEIGAFMALLANKLEQSNKDYERTLRQYESLLSIVQEMDKRADVNESDLKVAIRDLVQVHQSIDKQGSRIGSLEQEIGIIKTRLDRWESSLKTVATLFTILVTLAGLYFAFLQSSDSLNKKKENFFFPPPQKEVANNHK